MDPTPAWISCLAIREVETLPDSASQKYSLRWFKRLDAAGVRLLGQALGVVMATRRKAGKPNAWQRKEQEKAAPAVSEEVKPCPYCDGPTRVYDGDRRECGGCGAWELQSRALTDAGDPSGLYRAAGGWAPGQDSVWPGALAGKIRERIKKWSQG